MTRTANVLLFYGTLVSACLPQTRITPGETATVTQTVECQPKVMPRAEALAELRALKPLPKPHYVWPWDESTDAALVDELVRVTGTVTIHGDFDPPDVIASKLALAKKHNATLGVLFVPKSQTDLGRVFVRIGGMVPQLAERLPSVVIFDYEDPKATAGDFEKLHEAASASWPAANVEFYGQGIRASASVSGWSAHVPQSLNPLHGYSCSLYSLPNQHGMRETMRRTYEVAVYNRVDSVTPWVALASGYVPDRDPKIYQRWEMDWNYPTDYSYQLGAEINNDWYGKQPQRFAPWLAVKRVILYPPPSSATLHWWEHFVAYAQGAAK